VFVGGRDAIRVVDASRPSAPVEIAAVPFAADVFDMAADRGILAVASGDDMLRLYDVSVPQNPILVHSRSMTAFSLAFQSHHLLAGGAGGLQVLDVQNPAAPVESGSLGAPLTVFNIDLERDLALLSGRVGTFGDLAGQFVVDVNDPTRPRLAGGNAQLFGATTSSRGMSYGNFSAGALNAWRINPLTTSHVLSSTDALVEIPKRMNPGFYDVLAVSPGGQFHIMRQAVEVVRSSARGNSGHR